MTDPLKCLRRSSIAIAIWNIIYSLIQLGVMGWQTKEVKNRQWEYENRQLPATGAIDGFQARFPGLYAIYTETPERRRINAMYAIVLINVFLAFVHFFMSTMLLYGSIKYNKNCVWPWFFSAGPIIIMSTVYAVMWWSGDVFNEQLTMSVAEFVMSLAVNGICLVIVMFFYWRLKGKLTSNKPARKHSHRRQEPSYTLHPINLCPHSRTTGVLKSDQHTPIQTVQDKHRANIPPWRTNWPEVPDPQLQKSLHRKRSRGPRELGVYEKGNDGSFDFYAPELYDAEFPWKLTSMSRKARMNEERPKTTAETIKKMYYTNFPDEVPHIPHGMRSSLRKERQKKKHSNQVAFRNELVPHQQSGEMPMQKHSIV